MFGRKKITKEELEAKKRELEQLQKEYEEISKKLEETKRKLAAAKGAIGGKIIVNVIAGPNSIITRKGKITPAGIIFKLGKQKYVVAWKPEHIIFRKKGIFSKTRAEIYVDPDAGVSVPPPTVPESVRGTATISAGAVQGALMLYRTFMTRSIEKRYMTMMLIMFLAMAAVLLIAFWIYTNNVSGALASLQKTLEQLNQFLNNLPPTPQPVPPAG